MAANGLNTTKVRHKQKPGQGRRGSARCGAWRKVSSGGSSLKQDMGQKPGSRLHIGVCRRMSDWKCHPTQQGRRKGKGSRPTWSQAQQLPQGQGMADQNPALREQLLCCTQRNKVTYKGSWHLLGTHHARHCTSIYVWHIFRFYLLFNTR